MVVHPHCIGFESQEYTIMTTVPEGQESQDEGEGRFFPHASTLSRSDASGLLLRHLFPTHFINNTTRSFCRTKARSCICSSFYNTNSYITKVPRSSAHGRNESYPDLPSALHCGGNGPSRSCGNTHWGPLLRSTRANGKAQLGRLPSDTGPGMACYSRESHVQATDRMFYRDSLHCRMCSGSGW